MIERPKKCEGCPLNPSTPGYNPRRGGGYVPPAGPPGAKLLFVGIAPGAAEEQAQEPLVGPSGYKLAIHLLWGVGEQTRRRRVQGRSFRRSPTLPPHRKLNLVQCRTTQEGKRGLINRDPTAAEIRFCAHRFLWPELARSRAEVVVPLGALPYKTLTFYAPRRGGEEVQHDERDLPILSKSGKLPGGMAGPFGYGVGHRIEIPQELYQQQVELSAPKKKKVRKK